MSWQLEYIESYFFSRSFSLSVFLFRANVRPNCVQQADTLTETKMAFRGGYISIKYLQNRNTFSFFSLFAVADAQPYATQKNDEKKINFPAAFGNFTKA